MRAPRIDGWFLCIAPLARPHWRWRDCLRAVGIAPSQPHCASLVFKAKNVLLQDEHPYAQNRGSVEYPPKEYAPIEFE